MSGAADRAAARSLRRRRGTSAGFRTGFVRAISSPSIPGMVESIREIPGVFFPGAPGRKMSPCRSGLLLRDELKRRGVGVQMTRTSDTLIALGRPGRLLHRSRVTCS